MPTNPLAQFLLCALLVLVLWVLCGPILRRLSKPKAPPSLDDLMRADIDHAKRRGYDLRRNIERDTAEAVMLEERGAYLERQLLGEERPKATPSKEIGRMHVHLGVKVDSETAGTDNDPWAPRVRDLNVGGAAPEDAGPGGIDGLLADAKARKA